MDDDNIISTTTTIGKAFNEMSLMLVISMLNTNMMYVKFMNIYQYHISKHIFEQKCCVAY